MTAEGSFPKVDGDILYGSEANYQVGNFLLVTAGETITAGNIVYIKQSDGKAYISDTGNSDKIRATGIAPNNITSAAIGLVQVFGIYTTTSLTANTTYYLGSSGAISTTRSAVQLGIAVSTTKLNINIIQDDRDAIGTVKSYLKSFTNLPTNNFCAFWVECAGQTLSDTESPLNGQVIPNLNTGTYRMLRGSSTSGATGGADSHTHGAPAGGGANTFQGGVAGATTSSSNIPAYYEVVWIMKVK